MGKGGGGNRKSQAEIDAEMKMNRENQAAYEKQAQASIEAARIQANAYSEAAKAQANAQIEAAKSQSEAAIKSSQNAAVGGIIGAALGAHTTHEEIKQWLPHEVGAATIQSWEMAQKWNKTMTMKEQGYQDVAINYELSGKKGSALFSDAQWNALEMARLTKQDMLTNARIFGIQSAKNPGGIPLTREDWVGLNSLKDPSELLQVDPQVKAQRQEAFAKWEQEMRASGKGILVDIYKNPQLGGSSILTMKGKDPLLDPSIAPLLGSIAGTSGTSGGTNWNDAIGALTKGEKNPMTDQINWAMQNGLIDKYGMINSGVLLSFIPPQLKEAPEFNFKKPLDEQTLVRLTDQYDLYSNMANDPKLIQEQNVGFGVTRRVKLNADGTIAGTAMEGYMTDMMGNPVFVSMQGNRLQEFYDRQSMIGGMGPLFPGMLAPVTMDDLSGKFEPGFWGQNQLAKPNGGVPGQAETRQMAAPKMAAAAPKTGGGAPGLQNPYQVPTGKDGETKASEPATAGGLAKSLAGKSAPSGYSGAPLAAGE